MNLIAELNCSSLPLGLSVAKTFKKALTGTFLGAGLMLPSVHWGVWTLLTTIAALSAPAPSYS